MEQKTKKREWIKTVAIIFLSVLLVFTFFSQTIMNHSLPEVAVQAVTSGAVNTRIRAGGTVTANETYDVTINQTRKIRSVKVRVGDTVAEGDVLFTLEPMESEELKMAQEQLEQMELAYQKRLIEISNTASTQDRTLQKLQEAYNEALKMYQLYSTAEPGQIAYLLKEAEAKLSDLQDDLEDANEAYGDASEALADAQQEAAEAEAEMNALESEISSLLIGIGLNITAEEAAQQMAKNLRDIQEIEKALKSTEALDQAYADLVAYKEKIFEYHGENITYGALYEQFCVLTENEDNRIVTLCVTNPNMLVTILAAEGGYEDRATLEYAEKMIEVYLEVRDHLQANIDAVTENMNSLEARKAVLENENLILEQVIELQNKLQYAQRTYTAAVNSLAGMESYLETLEDRVDRAQDAVDAQNDVVSDYREASSAAATLEAAEEALEDRLFELSLEDSGDLDLEAEKQAIETQKQLVALLMENADGQEIKAPVSGTVSEIAVNAGSTAGAESTLATITVADRGYTMRVTVTAEQARQVRIGDTAELANYYWSDITATLENIANDPQSMGQKKILIFRLTGSVEPGANLTLSIGQKSAAFDAIVPNSAIRTDSNGTFVLLVTAKNSPLGNRFIATRAEVTVLAQDDTHSAVTGVVNGDFVITTSSVPIAAGDQIRMVDEG